MNKYNILILVQTYNGSILLTWKYDWYIIFLWYYNKTLFEMIMNEWMNEWMNEHEWMNERTCDICLLTETTCLNKKLNMQDVNMENIYTNIY